MDRNYLCINISVTDLYRNQTKCTKAMITSKMHSNCRLPVDSTLYRLSHGRYTQRPFDFRMWSMPSSLYLATMFRQSVLLSGYNRLQREGTAEAGRGH